MIYTSNIVRVNKIDIHFLDYSNDKPYLLLMHGLTANAHAFDAFVKSGLADHHHVISVDLRGRGLSSKPPFDYSIEEHAKDIIALIDYLKIDKLDVCGHSFGGLLGAYLCFNFSERFNKIVILDAAPQMNPNAGAMLGPALSRLGMKFDTFEDYIHKVKKAPYNTFWDETMLSYYNADVHLNSSGTLESRSSVADITQIAINTNKEPWAKYFEDLAQPCLLIHAIENYTMDQPLLRFEDAQKAVASMLNGKYEACDANHQTMLYGEPAKENVKKIVAFLKS